MVKKTVSKGRRKLAPSVEALFGSTTLYQQILDTAMEGIWMIDPHGVITYVNEHMAAMLDCSRADMIRRPVTEFLDAGGRAVMKRRVQMKTKRKREVFEMSFQRRNGETAWAIVSANPLFDARGSYIGCVAMLTDITERKRREQELHGTESILRSLMRSAFDGMYVKDLHGTYRMMNEAGAGMVGMKPADIIGKQDRLLFPREIAQLSMQTDRVVLRDGKPLFAEQSIMLEGNRRHFFTKKIPYRDAAGEIIGIVGISIEITKLKQAEEEVKRHKELLEQITRYIEEIFWIAEFPSGEFLYVSPALGRSWGIPAQELMRNPHIWTTVLHPEDREKVLANFRQTFDKRQGNLRIELVFRIIKKNGSVRWMRSRSFPVRRKNGKQVRVVGIVQDITREKRDEERLLRSNEELRRSKERIAEEMRKTKIFQQAADHSIEAILMFDDSMRIRYVNRAWEKLSGYSAKEQLGKHISLFEAAQSDPILYHAIQKTIGTMAVFQSDQIVLGRKDGTAVPVELRLYPIAGASRLFVALCNDITERKKIEHAKSEFSSLVAHQLKTPVAEMRGMVENMLQGITGELNDRQKEYLVAMYKSSKRNLRLISDLLNVSRIQRGIISADIASVPLRDVLGEVIRDYKPVIEGKHLTLHVDDIPEVRILADHDKLLEAIANVMHNAIKFTDKGGIRLETFVEEKHVRIEVKDTGIGISARNMKKLFRRDQIFSGKPIAGGGAGLGLYIAKQFMLAQNGDITATSKLRHGSTFVFAIPLDSVQ